MVHCCDDCGKTFHTYHQHTCYEIYCKICKKNQPIVHNPLFTNATFQPQPPKKQSDGQIYIFSECQLDDDKKHIRNLCVAHKVCNKCMEQPITDPGCTCDDRQQVIFRGEDSFADFCMWLFSGQNKDAICLAHNAQAYDLYLILGYFHENGIKSDIIQNGRKILCLDTCGTKLIDSLNYFNTTLAKLSKLFALNELHRGYFPRLFSTKENQHYKGKIPAASYYDPDGMKPDKHQEFVKWYHQQTAFDFQVDLEKYCNSDVDILQHAI